jgi:hypothetical protein
MSASLIGQLFSSLYSLVKEEAKVKRKMTRTRAGHLFEDVTAQEIYSHARSLGLRPNPPRHTLSYPTFSGGSYQFDASFSLGDVTYVIECKRTKMPAKVHIHYFNSQILDYLFGAKIRKDNLVMKGIFLSTVKVRESSMIYAIANGITVIDPVSPPLEYMISTLKEGSVLSKAMKQLLEKWPDSSSILDFDRVRRWSASDLFKEYRFVCKRWRDEYEIVGKGL